MDRRTAILLHALVLLYRTASPVDSASTGNSIVVLNKGAKLDRSIPPIVRPIGRELDKTSEEEESVLSDRDAIIIPPIVRPSLIRDIPPIVRPREISFGDVIPLRYAEYVLPDEYLAEEEERAKKSMGLLRMGRDSVVSLRRLARSVDHENDKRSMGMLRMGRSSDDGEELSELAHSEENKRSMGMLRMGRNAEDKRSMGMLRMGRNIKDNLSEEEAKRSMGMLRMGRDFNEDNENSKRSMGMLRMGRGIKGDEVKRSMGMLRMGK